jgi:hypothetical protein
MELSGYARQMGMTYHTALGWFKSGKIEEHWHILITERQP